jgi:hypothetical protein
MATGAELPLVSCSPTQDVHDLGHIARPLSGAAIDAGAFEQ